MYNGLGAEQTVKNHLLYIVTFEAYHLDKPKERS